MKYKISLEVVAKSQNPIFLLIALIDIVKRRQADADADNEDKDFDVISYEQDILKIETNTISLFLKIKPKLQQVLVDDSVTIKLKPSEQFSFFDELSQDELDGKIDEDWFVEIKVNNDHHKISFHKFGNICNKLLSPSHHNVISNQRIDFISTNITNEKKLSSLYGHIVDMGMMEAINVFLREFDSRIESLIIRPSERHSVFKIKLKDKKEPVLLSSMGGGLNRYIAIVCAIWKNQDGHLLIDEVENGIHYTKYEKLWEIIFKTSMEANCQVFLTSHSKECIEAFTRVAERYDNENIKYLNFSRRVDNADKIVVTVLDSVGLENHFGLGLDIR